MLTLTDKAEAAIRNLTGGDSGLRIAAENEGSQSLVLMLSDAPHQGDHVVESGGARVFLEESAADTLTDKQLDAQVTEDGNTSFLLAQRRQD